MYSLLRRGWETRTHLVRAKSYGRAKPVSSEALEGLVERLVSHGVNDVVDEVGGRKRTRGARAEALHRIKSGDIKFTRGRPPDDTTSSHTLKLSTWDDTRTEFDLKPGDYVELGATGARLTSGVILGQRYFSREMHIITLTEKGSIISHTGDTVRFTIPGLVSSDLAARCGLLETPENDHHYQARVKVLRYLSQLKPATVQAAFDARVSLANAHDLLADKDPSKQTITTLSHLTRMFKRKPTFIDLIAVNRFVMDNLQSFVPQRNFHVTQEIIVRSYDEKNRMALVREWIEQPTDSPIDSFSAKAKPIIEKNIALREATMSEPPSFVMSGPVWDKNDKIIIEYLADAYLSCHYESPFPYMVDMSFIIGKLYPHFPSMGFHECLVALVDLGAFPPWQDDTLHFREIDPVAVEAALNKFFSQKATASPAKLTHPTSQVLGPDDFYLVDPMESFRHDFGDLPVYVIDQSDAQELDDGLSIEDVAGEQGIYWLHVHVADPCSSLPPSHFLYREAERRYMTAYRTMSTDHMIPPSFSQSMGLSLGSQRPQKCLTFSAKVNASGDILDYKVRAGLINNILTTSYDTMDHAMNWAPVLDRFPFGNPLPLDIISLPAAFGERSVKDITMLKAVRDAFMARRFRDNVFLSGEDTSYLQVLGDNTTHLNQLWLDGRSFRGFVDLHFGVRACMKFDRGMRSVVAESMKVACRVASMYCRDNDVPVLRRMLPRPPVDENFDIDSLLDSRTPEGYVSRVESIPFLDYDLSSSYTLDTEEHWSVGARAEEGYTRITSPLRRFTDLQVHYQIHASLRGEKLLYSRDDLLSKAELYAVSDRWTKRLDGRSRLTWQVTFLERWQKMVKDGRVTVDPLENLEAIITDVPQRHPRKPSFVVSAMVPRLGLRVSVQNLPTIDQAVFGQTIRVNNMKIARGYHPFLWMDMVPGS